MTWLENYFKSKLPLIERGLDGFLSGIADSPPLLTDSMKYSVKAGGKRLRPVLVIACAEALGCPGRRVIPAACSLEMIHTYSLIHDDLPAMDDDDIRRGVPTNHKVYGEGIAILAGDALLTHAFKVLCRNAGTAGHERTIRAMDILSHCSGAAGMVGGQVADLQAEGYTRSQVTGKSQIRNPKSEIPNPNSKFRTPQAASRNLNRLSPEKLLEYIHFHKTAALIQAGCEMGAVLAGADRRELRCFSGYGRAIGLAFQITDDILDVTGDKKKLGKNGSDAKNGKLTYASLFGVDAAGKKARHWVEKAHGSLSKLGREPGRLRPLHELADFILKRSH